MGSKYKQVNVICILTLIIFAWAASFTVLHTRTFANSRHIDIVALLTTNIIKSSTTSDTRVMLLNKLVITVEKVCVKVSLTCYTIM